MILLWIRPDNFFSHKCFANKDWSLFYEEGGVGEKWGAKAILN